MKKLSEEPLSLEFGETDSFRQIDYRTDDTSELLNRLFLKAGSKPVNKIRVYLKDVIPKGKVRGLPKQFCIMNYEDVEEFNLIPNDNRFVDVVGIPEDISKPIRLMTFTAEAKKQDFLFCGEYKLQIRVLAEGIDFTKWYRITKADTEGFPYKLVEDEGQV
jgi:hypothetical protein